ncbi:hypothetical protein B0H19DRAFT_1058249 [Mycena capillaripes]|nr:hypothetical protein B0H19DRAFT_1058249 [Mycena capillaripes]
MSNMFTEAAMLNFTTPQEFQNLMCCLGAQMARKVFRHLTALPLPQPMCNELEEEPQIFRSAPEGAVAAALYTGMFSGSQNLNVTAQTLTNTTNHYTTVLMVPSGSRLPKHPAGRHLFQKRNRNGLAYRQLATTGGKPSNAGTGNKVQIYFQGL